MIPTATLLTAAFGLITSAIAAQAADANIQIAALSQRSLPTYSLTDTGSFEPAYGDRSASDINFLGHVVGFEQILQIVRPFLYANGRSIDLTPLLPPLGGNATGGYATAINIRDQVVGYISSRDERLFPPQSFLYQNGKALIFGMPNSLWTRATGINDFGQIVGYFEGNVEGALEHPFLRQPNGKLSDLGTFGGISATASAINDRGQIAVNVDRADGSFHALLASSKRRCRELKVFWYGIGSTSLFTAGASSRQKIGFTETRPLRALLLLTVDLSHGIKGSTHLHLTPGHGLEIVLFASCINNSFNRIAMKCEHAPLGGADQLCLPFCLVDMRAIGLGAREVNPS